jgi:membrane-bound metal-dependent hydrolase YbcI (DUF457 family)
MPFTPYHFGPSGCIAILLYKRIDVLIFLLVNVALDIEPLLVIVFSLQYPIHGYAHTLFGAAIIGTLLGTILYIFKNPIQFIMVKLFRFPYESSKKKMIISGIGGGWFHIILDSLFHADIRPFYPLNFNPLYGIISRSMIYKLCAILFILALILYFAVIIKRKTLS